MKLTIKTEVEQEIEINLPIYRKGAVTLIRINESNVIIVYSDSIVTYPTDSNAIKNYYSMPESTKEDFDEAFDEAITSITKLK